MLSRIKNNIGLRTKLTLPAIAGLFIFVLIIYGYWEPKLENMALTGFIEQTISELSAMENDIVRNILSKDFAALYSSLDSQKKRRGESWNQLTVYDINNKIIYPLIPEEHDKDIHDFHVLLEYQLKHNESSIGHIKIHGDWHKEYNEAEQYINELLQFLFTIMLFLFLLSFLFQLH